MGSLLLACAETMLMKPHFNFLYPTSPSHGAWCLAVAIIAQADLHQSTPVMVLRFDEVFMDAETIPYEWLREAIGRANGFGVGVYESADFEESGYCSLCFFTRLGYRSSPSRVEIDFHKDALPYLKQLQEVIHQVYQRGALTPSNLTRKMKTVAPLTQLDMKKNHRYDGPAFTMYRHNGKIVDALVQQ
ncbi:hypothetical protein [Hymenobacter convexus]|uniref:hypothetical protein n=1 Tax=Hymenobacter sp. CA1UV-4 TaxID=3063782 RepID=UPI002713B97A|nr:hypothetical protein [Hymenobacter sp. CA1UV-4]MDO7850399.1 hypothetical protein [Hymenobacter sp. CA1UV-4]